MTKSRGRRKVVAGLLMMAALAAIHQGWPNSPAKAVYR